MSRAHRPPPRIRRPAAVLAVAAIMASALAAAPLAARSLSSARIVTRFEDPNLHLHPVEATNAALRFDLRRAEAREARARRAAATGIRSLEATAPSAIGAWAPPVPMMVSGVTSVQLPTGRVLFFSKTATATVEGNEADAWTWNPASGDWNHVPPPINPVNGKPFNIWCSGQSFLSDGRLVVAGGNGRYPIGNAEPSEGNGYIGLDRIFTFNPFDETWTEQPKMQHGRWYPTLVTLPDDRVVILGGIDESTHEYNNGQLEVFTPSPAMNGQGSITVKDGAYRDTQLYPHLKYFPGNRIVMTGPDRGDTAILDTTTWTWTDLPDIPVDRLWGASVVDPYDAATGPTSVSVIGGSNGGSATADGKTYRLNLASGAPSWTSGPTMKRGRSHLNAQLLPDGTTLALGGGIGLGPKPDSLYAGPVYTAEITNAAGTAWTEIDAEVNRRTYHSTSLLLADGRVISTGDDKGGAIRDMEVYSPPYLFRGARPTISDAPAAVTYGTAFRVATPDAPTVTGAVLMAPTATTHSTDMSQRAIRLKVTPETAGSVFLDAPTSAESVLPGYYMLYLLNSAGLPSDAKWVRIAHQSTPAPPPVPVDPPPVTTPPRAPATPVTTPVETTRGPVRIPPKPQAFLSAKLVRAARGHLWVTVQLGRAGTLKVSAETRKGPRQLCVVGVKVNATVRCRLDGRLRGSDRVILTLTGRDKKATARILKVG